jgi:uncharacterized spore protein YtfJ
MDRGHRRIDEAGAGFSRTVPYRATVMQVTEPLTSMVESLRENAAVETVYGEPVQGDGVTVVPVARVAYGFGGGYGSSAGTGTDGGSESAPEDDRATDSEGGGLGGGLVAAPVGVVEVSRDGARFVRFGDRKRAVGAFLLGIALGSLLGRRDGGS